MSPKKLKKMARMWEKLAISRRRRISNPGVSVELNSSSALEKGHCVIYTTDGGHFMIPLQCLRSNIFEELFKSSKEEFGLSGHGDKDGPVTVPCDAASTEYIVLLVRRSIAKDIEEALLSSIAFTPCLLAVAMNSKCVYQQVLFLGQLSKCWFSTEHA